MSVRIALNQRFSAAEIRGHRLETLVSLIDEHLDVSHAWFEPLSSGDKPLSLHLILRDGDYWVLRVIGAIVFKLFWDWNEISHVHRWEAEQVVSLESLKTFIIHGKTTRMEMSIANKLKVARWLWDNVIH